MGTGTVDDRHSRLLEGVHFEPVFILGAHRTGTTLLYQALQATGCFNTVTLYHVVCYDRILHDHLGGKEGEAKDALRSRLRDKDIFDRAIDGVAVNPDLPEEYGFILRNAALGPHVDNASLPKFMELCKKVQLVSGTSRPLLLKNPRDSVRFRYLHEEFPAARFLFIHRDPVHAINSQLKAIRAVFASRNEYLAILNASYRRMYANPFRLAVSRIRVSARLGADLRRARRDYAQKARYFLENITSLPGPAYHSVRYEDLCAKPAEVLGDILEFLQLPASAAADPGALIRPRATALLDEVEKQQADIRRSLREYSRYCGYGEG